MGFLDMFGLKNDNDIKDELLSNGYKIDKTFYGVDKCLMLCLEKKVLIITPVVCKKSNNKKDFISFSDIVDVELVIDKQQYSSSNRLGRAVIGGVLFGGIGAIVGGLSASSYTIDEFEDIDIIIKLNNVLNPTYTFAVNRLKYKSADFDGKEVLKNAKEIYETILRVINQKRI